MVRFADSPGIVRSRAIEPVCHEHVTVAAWCSMTVPHFTTMAHFVSRLRSVLCDNITQLFAAVRTVCDGQRLIGREMCAMDGVTLPSNASTHRSGTRAEFTPRTEPWEAAAPTMLTGTARRTVCRTRAPDERAGSVARRVARGEAVAPGMCAE